MKLKRNYYQFLFAGIVSFGLVELCKIESASAANRNNTSRKPSNLSETTIEPDSNTDNIIEIIKLNKESKKKILPVGNKAEFAIFMDFDGTIISGDITDGGNTSNQPDKNSHYKGLSEQVITAGQWNHKVFTFDEGKELNKAYEKYTEKFNHRMETDGHYIGYEWSASLFSNLQPQVAEKIIKIRDDYFKNTLNKYLFDSSVQFIKKLNEDGIEVYIVSASPTIFIQGASVFFKNEIPFNHIFGIDMSTYESGARIDPITNYAEGKIQRIEKIIADGLKENKKIIPIAGFGNSWKTDGAFLRWIVKNDGTSVMINGGTPPDQNKDTLKVLQVNQSKLYH